MALPKFRILKVECITGAIHYHVEMWHIFHWIVIKSFDDEDTEFAKREAEELFDKLMEQ